MRFLSICSGIEAASVAWNPLGWEAAAFSEIEPFPCSVLAHHYPSVPNRGDMTKFQDWPDESIDLLCGGTPCQSFSVAGLRKGLADPRGNLMLVYGAIAAKYRPRWLVWENVPGVLSSNEGRDFGAFLGMLGQLGYGFAYRVLDAQFFGVAQRRRRVFVVGCLGDWRSAAAVLFERHSLSGHPAPSREAGQIVTPTIRAGAANGGAGHGARSGDSKDELIVPHGIPERARALTTSCQRIDAETETLLPVAHSLRGEGFDASEDGTGRGTPLVPVAFDTTQMTSAANRSNPKPGDPCHPLAAGAHAPGIAYTTKLHNTASNNAGKVFEERATCLDANSPPPALLTAMQVRRLTPRECERLQGFPDDYTAVPHRGKPAADGPRYKALGNSWAVPCARWIGQRIQAVDGIVRFHAAVDGLSLELEAA
mgnify:CR=1 FL=1